MPYKSALFPSFRKSEKSLTDQVECPIILHEMIEDREMNNFCSRHTNQKCVVKVAEVSQMVSS
jgi:hypothetical protein